jgi:hypothetical protein
VPWCVCSGSVILQVAFDLSEREAMTFLNLNEVCTTRWTYMLFILVSALLFLAFVLLLPSAPSFVSMICVISYAGEWGAVFKARLVAVGLPQSRWVVALYGLFVFIACFLLSYLASKGRFFFPGLFVLLNLPLILLKEKSSMSGSAGPERN